jgi:protein-S-isoprenylcysteine O-methyltransferase Ste14
MPRLLKEIDIPPSWLILHILGVWALSYLSPAFFGAAGDWAGKVLIALGILIMGGAILQMARHRTTVIPRRNPSALVTDGLFGLSRNPIYLADALILLGVVLWLDAAWALPLVASFVWLIETRFIRDEEARLTAGFGPEFDLWAARTRRWIGRK